MSIMYQNINDWIYLDQGDVMIEGPEIVSWMRYKFYCLVEGSTVSSETTSCSEVYVAHCDTGTFIKFV